MSSLKLVNPISIPLFATPQPRRAPQRWPYTIRHPAVGKQLAERVAYPHMLRVRCGAIHDNVQSKVVA